MADILIVEDEELINNLLKENLSLVGHTCTQAYDGIEAESYIRSGSYDLILLDIMLPGRSGYDILSDCSGIPIILLTAKDGTYDKVKGLNMGAEDYIVKPFDMLELIARVNVVLRRNRTGGAGEIFTMGELQVDLQSRTVRLGDREISLMPKEYELLEYFIHNRNIALSRERLIEQVWGWDYAGDTRTVDVHVASLRKKLKLEKRLKTVYKLGYRLEV